MEAVLSSSNADNLIHGLDFSLNQNTTSYVEERSESMWFASSNYFSLTGVRTIRVNVAGNTFVDLSTMVLTGVLHNDGTGALQPHHRRPARVHLQSDRLLQRYGGR